MKWIQLLKIKEVISKWKDLRTVGFAELEDLKQDKGLTSLKQEL